MAKEKNKPEETPEEEFESKDAPEEEVSEEEQAPLEEPVESEEPSEYATVVMAPQELELTDTGEIAPISDDAKEDSSKSPTLISEPPGDDFDEATIVDADIELLDLTEDTIVDADIDLPEILLEEELPPAKPEIPEEIKDFRRKRWLQFPRRLLLILLSLGIGLLLIEGLKLLINWSLEDMLSNPISWDTITSVSSQVHGYDYSYLQASLEVLGAAVIFALIFAILAAMISVLNHKFKGTLYAPFGSLIKGIGRTLVFPTFGGSLLLIVFVSLFLFVFQFGIYGIKGSSINGGISFLLPGLIIGMLPGMLAGQTLSKAMTQVNEKRSLRTWGLEILRIVDNLLDMVGVLISSLIVFEIIFGYRGIGRLLYNALRMRDFPTAISVLHTIVILVAVFRIVAQLLRWLHRLLKEQAPQVDMVVMEEAEILETEDLEEAELVQATNGNFIINRWAGLARTVWMVLAVLGLIIPIAIYIYGNAVDFSRDALNQIAVASTGNLPTAIGIALIVVIISGLFGLASSLLKKHGKFWSESIADLLLLPSDVGLLFPIIPLAMILMEWLMAPSFPQFRIISQETLPANAHVLTIVLVGFLLAARGVRFSRELWLAVPKELGRMKKAILVLPFITGFFFAALYAGLWYETLLSFLGWGVNDINLSFGKVIASRHGFFQDNPTDLIVTGILLTLILTSFYMLADALIGYFKSKEPMAKLFE